VGIVTPLFLRKKTILKKKNKKFHNFFIFIFQRYIKNCEFACINDELLQYAFL